MAEKTLLVYYSRTGKAEMLAKKLQEKLKCDTDIIDYAEKERISFLGAAMESMKKATVPIKGDDHSPESYERIVFVTPIWKGSLSTPVRSYIQKHKSKIRLYSLIAVSGKVGFEGTLKEAKDIFGKEPYASAHYTSAQIANGSYTVDSLAL